ncbi:MAG TPA: acetolactate synthase large subunit [Bauldia sp.]|nr:acetolactate synthase large subunit [Bauldia sp.]
MNGAESLVRTLLACGVDTVFANPGTSEMHFVAALDRVPGMRVVLATFEGVVAGAADGYARMSGKPAATLLHCAPGLANGLANFHNARRGHVPIVSIVGDQATYHKPLDPLLAADTIGFASGVSAWVRTAHHPSQVGAYAAEAVQAATAPPGGVATLILPSDASWSEGGAVAGPLPSFPPAPVEESAIADAVTTLRSGEATVIILADAALRRPAIDNAARIAAATGAHLISETFNTRAAHGAGLPDIGRIPYPIDAALAVLAPYRHAILVGAHDPVAFFAYPGRPGRQLPADARVHVLARPEEDGVDALARLAAALSAPPAAMPARPRAVPVSGAVTPQAFAQTLAALLPDNAVVVDEALTFGFPLYAATAAAAPHDCLQLTGGAIGDGLPMSTGAALGAPGRRVIDVQADGSALYTVQALWTQAREKLDVTTVVLANRRYEILFGELAGVGAAAGPASRALFGLGRPDHDWVKLAAGFGVEGARAETMEQFADLFMTANRRSGPFLIELVIP